MDAAANGLWTFMWFVAFVYLADQWRKTPYKDNFPPANRNCANSGVAFSFFCMFIWVRTQLGLFEHIQNSTEVDVESIIS